MFGMCFLQSFCHPLLDTSLEGFSVDYSIILLIYKSVLHSKRTHDIIILGSEIFF